MNIHEYQAKKVLMGYRVPVPRGDVARNPETAQEIAHGLGGKVVVKAQIHAGGRGKGRFRDAKGEPVARPDGRGQLGGVVVVDGPIEARDVARAMLGNVLVTKQSGAEGRQVRQVLVEEALPIAREFYLALLLDRGLKSPVFVASAEGGTEIEEVAARRPEAILKVPVDARVGFFPWVGRKVGFGLGLGKDQVLATTRLMESMYQGFVASDASLVEVNPLIETTDGRIVALDAKMNFDDNALYRQAAIRELRDLAEEDPLEVEASKYGLNYIKLDGQVGCMVNGAGLAMGTMDIIKHHGGSPANFLDVGGSATTEMVTNAFRILLGDTHVKAVLINIFGGIMRCDVVAEGVVTASRALGVQVPVVVRLEGTNVEKGKQILLGSGLKFEVADGLDDAARKVVAAVKGN